MTDYHQNLFGEVVDVDLAAGEEDYSDDLKAERSDFNIFSFTDALGARDKKQAWILYHKALTSGLSAEELFYKAVWIVKTMMLAGKSRSAEEAGLNPFVYKKAQSFLKKFKKGEVEKLSEDLVIGYHEARRGKGDLETALEKIILSL